MTGKETIKMLDDQYAKLLLLVMIKYRLTHIVLSHPEIMEQVGPDGNLKMCISVQELEDGLHIKAITWEEAEKLQALENKFDPPRNG